MKSPQKKTQIPEDCRDQHLAMVPEYATPFRTQGIRGVGIHEVHEPYQIHRDPVSWHIVLLTLSGKGSYTCGKQSGTICENDLWIGPANRAYSYQAEGNWHFISAALYKIDDFVQLEKQVTHQHVQHSLQHLKPAIEAYLFESTLQHNQKLPLASSLANYISKAIRRELNLAPPDEDIRLKLRLHQLWETVNATPGNDWRLVDLSQEVAVSVRQFQRLMRLYYNLTAEQMLTRLRMEHARELLSARDLSQAEIADRVGYQSVYSFSKAFKRHYGQPPGAYAKENHHTPFPQSLSDDSGAVS
jgi:AraC-like DNA-binding protein